MAREILVGEGAEVDIACDGHTQCFAVRNEVCEIIVAVQAYLYAVSAGGMFGFPGTGKGARSILTMPGETYTNEGGPPKIEI